MPTGRSRRRIDQHFERTDEAIAMATTWTAWHMHADAIIALTESGATAMMMSRNGVRIPIFALTPRERTRERMTLCGGVYPVAFHPSSAEMLVQVREAIHLLTERGLLQNGQRVLLTRGDTTAPGGTNTMKILTVG
jgi:pyruvate kinase